MSELNFGSYLKQLRLAKGFQSSHKLAAAASISQAFVSQMEHGKRLPSPEVIRKLSTALGVTHIGMMIKAGHITEEEVLTLRKEHGINDSESESEDLNGRKGINQPFHKTI